MVSADFNGDRISNIDMSYADLSKANFEFVWFHEMNFKRTSMRFANLKNTQLGSFNPNQIDLHGIEYSKIGEHIIYDNINDVSEAEWLTMHQSSPK